MNKSFLTSTHLAVLGIAILITAMVVFAGSTNIHAGNTYYTVLEGNMETNNWGGLQVGFDYGSFLGESADKFATMTFATNSLREVFFAGYNLDDDGHYYAAMRDPVFDTTRIEEISLADMQADAMFSSIMFPNLYRNGNYDSYSDNPERTFCPGGSCVMTLVEIDGQNYTAIEITLGTNVARQRPLYLIKYRSAIDEQPTPLFMSSIENGVCYSGTSCVAEFLLPVTNMMSYNFFAISKFPVYDVKTYVDYSVNPTNTFVQTGLPYVLDVQVLGLYDQLPRTNTDVVVAEDGGYNLFIPDELSGIVSTTYSAGVTDGTGFERFLVAPTKNTATNSYVMYAGVIYNDEITSEELLFVTNSNSFVTQKKPIAPSSLTNNIAASIIAMLQITSSLKTVSSSNLGRFLVAKYQLSNNTFEVVDSLGVPAMLKTGAPNIIDLQIFNGGSEQFGYYGVLREVDGYLLFNPTTTSTGLDDKQRFHLKTVESGASRDAVVTPTSYGPRNSIIEMDIYSPMDNLLGSITFNVNKDLELISSDYAHYVNGRISAFATKMAQLESSVYYAIN